MPGPGMTRKTGLGMTGKAACARVAEAEGASGVADLCHPRHHKREGPTSEAQWEGSRSDGPQNRGLPAREGLLQSHPLRAKASADRGPIKSGLTGVASQKFSLE